MSHHLGFLTFTSHNMKNSFIVFLDLGVLGAEILGAEICFGLIPPGHSEVANNFVPAKAKSCTSTELY